MLMALVLFAQEVAQEVAKDAGKGAESPASPFFQMMPILLIFLALWVIVILPAQRREKKQRESLFSNMKKNDEVLTSSGIIGTVHSIADDEITLKVDEGTKLRMRKASVVQILRSKDAETNIQAANK